MLVLYFAVLLGYITFQWERWHRGIPRNGPKLLLLLSIVPLHLIVFLHPLLALFVVPIVTVGHNLQYHRIVWMYGTRKYAGDQTGRYRWPQAVFRHLWLYLLIGFIFTFAFHRGPWIDFLERTLGLQIGQWIFQAIGLIAGITDATATGAGAEAGGCFLRRVVAAALLPRREDLARQPRPGLGRFPAGLASHPVTIPTPRIAMPSSEIAESSHASSIYMKVSL